MASLACAQPQLTPLSCGVVSSGSIGASGAGLFGVTVQKGDAILVRVRSAVTDPTSNFQLTQVLVEDITGRVILPRPIAFTIGANYAGEFDMDLTGTFQIVVKATAAGAFDIVYTNLNRPCNATTLTCGASSLGQITAPLQLATYQFAANQGDILDARIGLLAPYAKGFAPLLFAYGPDGHILIQTDNVSPAAVTPGNAPLADAQFPLPSTGIVTLVVFDAANVTGGYGVSVTKLNGPCNNSVNLTCGALVQGTLASPLSLPGYGIPASPGDVISLRVASAGTDGTFVPRASIYDPQGTFITAVYASTTGGHASASGTFTAKLNGAYFVSIADVATGVNTGSYVIGFTRLNRPCSAETPLACASLVNGSIAGLLASNLYSLSATANDVYLLRLLRTDQSGSSFRPRVDIYDSQGNAAQFLTATGLGQVTFTAASTGTYNLVLSDGFDNSQTGNYALALLRLNRPCNAGTLSCGALTSASFSQPLATAVYTYNAAPGESFSVRMMDVTGNLQPAVTVYDPSGSPVGQPLSGNFTGVDVPQPAGGAYAVVATDASPKPVGGPFDLDLLRTVNACGASPPQGQTTQGVISGAEPFLSYTIPASSGDSLLVRSAAFNSGFTAQMEIYDPAGARLDARTYSLSRSILAAGNYTVIVGPAAPRTGGAYSLSWQLLNNPAGTAPLACGGSTTASTGAANQFRYYTAAANSGDLLRMIFTPLSSNFSPAIELYDPAGARLSGSPDISQKAAAGGNYLVIVGPSSSNGQTGSFTVAFQRPNNPCSPTALTCGQTTLRLVNLPGQLDTYTFTGTASNQADIRLTQRSGSVSPYGELYNPSGALVATDAGGIVQPLLTASGAYTLLVRDRNANLGSYRVSLQNDTNTCPATDTEPPVVNLLKPTGGEVILGGSTYQIQWQSDDNLGVSSQAVDLSTDGGKTFPTSIAASLPGNRQSYTWIVPAAIAPSRTAVVRVTATDAVGNSQTAASGLVSVIGSGFTPNSATTYTYDGLNRITQAVLADGRTITYTWDLAGNLISIGVTGQ